MSQKHRSVQQLLRDQPAMVVAQTAKIARSVFYRMKQTGGGKMTLSTCIALTKAYPDVCFRIGRKRYVVRELGAGE